MTTEKNYTSWYFLIGVILFYTIVSLLNIDKFKDAFNFFIDIIIKIIPILIIIFISMGLINYFVKNKTLVKLMGNKSGMIGWIIAIITGILSSGPIYMWYPLLADLNKKGVKPGLIAVFLYNRAVKLPLLPIIIMYFGLKFTIILTIIMIITSIFQGIIIDKLIKK